MRPLFSHRECIIFFRTSATLSTTARSAHMDFGYAEREGKNTRTNPRRKWRREKEQQQPPDVSYKICVRKIRVCLVSQKSKAN
jgi:hypothetical protein